MLTRCTSQNRLPFFCSRETGGFVLDAGEQGVILYFISSSAAHPNAAAAADASSELACRADSFPPARRQRHIIYDAPARLHRRGALPSPPSFGASRAFPDPPRGWADTDSSDGAHSPGGSVRWMPRGATGSSVRRPSWRHVCASGERLARRPRLDASRPAVAHPRCGA